MIACEDTRVTAKLLRHYGIRKKTVSYNEHNAETSGPKLIEDVKSGKSVVLVSDAGTPIISDPGFRLVVEARAENISVTPLPGASAPLAALVASGLNSDSWTFAGFLPHKQGARVSRLEGFANDKSTMIFFESPNRIGKTLADMIEVFGSDRRGSIARELTKLHEEVTTASLQELSEHYENRTVKGEIVILVEPSSEEETIDVETILKELMQSMPVSKAAAEAAQLTGQSKRELYQKALSLKDET